MQHLLPRHMQIIFDIVSISLDIFRYFILISFLSRTCEAVSLSFQQLPSLTYANTSVGSSCRVCRMSLFCLHSHSHVFTCLAVEKKFPGDRERLARMSLIEGLYFVEIYVFFKLYWTSFWLEGVPQQVRMANLACIGILEAWLSFFIPLWRVFSGSRKVNGVAEVR